jgi:hypothetical protein
MSSRWKLLAAAPVLLLAVVALRQIHLARSADLTPWKGGGFGMFASTDGVPQRHLRVFATGPDRSEELTVPEDLEAVAARALVLPDDGRLERLARALAESERKAGRPVASLDLVVLRTSYSARTLWAVSEPIREYHYVVVDGG